MSGTIAFQPNESLKKIGIPIVDNDIYENDEEFYIHLSNARAQPITATQNGQSDPWDLFILFLSFSISRINQVCG